MVVSIEPNEKMNQKYNIESIFNLKVILSNFTVKNGYNADVKSLSSCTGPITKDADGEFEPPLDM